MTAAKCPNCEHGHMTINSGGCLWCDVCEANRSARPSIEQSMRERFELWYDERYARWPEFGDAKVAELFEAFKAGVLQVLP